MVEDATPGLGDVGNNCGKLTGSKNAYDSAELGLRIVGVEKHCEPGHGSDSWQLPGTDHTSRKRSKALNVGYAQLTEQSLEAKL